MPDPTPVAAVVPAFHPGPELVEAVRSLAGQVDLVVVVDDGPGGADPAIWEACRELGAEVVEHDRNRGIGAALNTGVRTVRDRLGAAAVLTLDQDSVLPSGYVARLLAAVAAGRAAALDVMGAGPEAVSGMARSPVSGAVRGVLLGREPIQSGLVLTGEALDRLGGFDEDLVIDGVDTDLYLRAVDAGMVLVVAPGAVVEHRVGHRVPVALPRGRTRSVAVAAPFRYYFQARNRVVLLRRHGRRHWRWALHALAHDVRHLASVTVLVPGRRQRLAASGQGWLDGLRGRLGPRP